MQKIIEAVKKNKVVAAIVVGILLLLIIALSIYLLLGGGEEEIPRGSIDQPFNYEEDKKIVINNDVNFSNYNPDSDRSAPVYTINQVNQVDNVKNFLREIGKGLMKIEAYEDVVYYWRENTSQDHYLVEYNALTDRLFFRFESAVDPNLSSTAYIQEDQLEAYFHSFVNTYLNENYKYTDFKISRTGGNYRIEANRLIGKYPLYISGFETFSDYLIIEEDGDILEGQFYIVNYDLGTAKNVDLVNSYGLGSVISRSDYPKEFNQGLIEDFDYTLVNGEPYNPRDGGLGDPPPTPLDNSMPELQECTAQSMSLGYLYLSKSFTMLTPAYRIDCVGEVQFRGNRYRASALVYANAIDPELVYVPGALE